jgi:hypothetical protein
VAAGGSRGLVGPVWVGLGRFVGARRSLAGWRVQRGQCATAEENTSPERTKRAPNSNSGIKRVAQVKFAELEIILCSCLFVFKAEQCYSHCLLLSHLPLNIITSDF